MVTRSKNIVESDPNNQKWKPNRHLHQNSGYHIYKYCFVLAALSTAQPLLNFISTIEVFYLQGLIYT